MEIAREDEQLARAIHSHFRRGTTSSPTVLWLSSAAGIFFQQTRFLLLLLATEVSAQAKDNPKSKDGATGKGSSHCLPEQKKIERLQGLFSSSMPGTDEDARTPGLGNASENSNLVMSDIIHMFLGLFDFEGKANAIQNFSSQSVIAKLCAQLCQCEPCSGNKIYQTVYQYHDPTHISATAKELRPYFNSFASQLNAIVGVDLPVSTDMSEEMQVLLNVHTHTHIHTHTHRDTHTHTHTSTLDSSLLILVADLIFLAGWFETGQGGCKCKHCHKFSVRHILQRRRRRRQRRRRRRRRRRSWWGSKFSLVFSLSTGTHWPTRKSSNTSNYHRAYVGRE